MKFTLKNRDIYLKKLIAFKDIQTVKVITGIRRCGKSSLLKLMINYLISSGINDEQIIEMNFESMEYYDWDNKQLYNYIISKVKSGKKTYLFFDEIQRIPKWQTAINSFMVDIDCDIYITGSNAFLLSSELSTYLSGRYVEIKMLPLSFSEFADFNNYKINEITTLGGITKKMFYNKDNMSVSPDELFDAYLNFGGMPSIAANMQLNQESVTSILDGIYSAVVIRDILERETGTIKDPLLLRKIIMFLADNIGNSTSATSIGNTLVNAGLLKQPAKKPAAHTIQTYINALTESYIFYEIKRFDIKGKEYLRTLGKYYIVDIGLRNYLLGFRNGDTGHILENVVFFELLRRGYNVAIGKTGNKEIDFIATKTNEKKYIQVCESIASEDTKKRELTPLEQIQDNYEKIILTRDRLIYNDCNGIRILNVVDFLTDI